MCGRFTLSDEILDLRDYFEFDTFEDYIPRYNIAPGQNILTVFTPNGKRIAKNMRWGLIPYWAKDEKIGYKMINARAEGIEEKPSFKSAFQRRRCLILADGFYEWKRTDSGKQPYRFIMKNHQPFAFAGLWETWTKKSQPVMSCTIITTTPNSVTEEVHDRMPVILPKDSYDHWLNPKIQDKQHLLSLLKPYPAEDMDKYPVSTLVNSAKNEMAELISPLNSL